MPVETSNYLLEGFIDGDSYSAIVDKRRFTTIDYQLNRVAEIIGDGRIAGWEIEEQIFPNVLVTLGNGIINGYYVNTFSDRYFELEPNETFYFYAQRRVGIIGISGPRSNVVNCSYIDSGPPSEPTNLLIGDPELLVGSYDYSIFITWTGIIDVDFDHYNIYRQDNGAGGFLLIDTSISTEYTDIVDENSTYEYKVFSVDQSGNESLLSALGSIVVPLATTLPPNPIEVQILEAESAINLLWKRPPNISFNKIDYWLVGWTELDTDNSPMSGENYNIVNKNLYNARIDDLENPGKNYKVTLYSVDNNGRRSTGRSSIVSPQPTPAPRDPQGIAYSFSEGEFGVKVSLSWTSGDTPYDPAISYRYRVYIQVDGENYSLPFDVNPIGSTEEQISLYTFDGLNYSSIPESTLVTVKITALDTYGFESYGNYVRFVTPLFSIPLGLSNLSAEFESGTRNLIIKWDNEIDTVDIQIVIVEDDLDGNYPDGVPDEILNERIGKVEKYILSNASLGHRYTISVTPYNIDDVAGPPGVVVEVTTGSTVLEFPLAPDSIQVQSGDRQVLLTWNKSLSQFANGYKIYKKNGSVTFSTSDWGIVDIIDNVHVTRFTDYGLENGRAYSYYITSTDIYGRETPHLLNGAVNLNFVSSTPRQEGILTEPIDISATLSGSDVIISWTSISEEFDAFTLYRSINNLHEWKPIATLGSDVNTYYDSSMPLIDGYTYYYTVGKSIDDADIKVQSSSIPPENSILLGSISLGLSEFGNINTSEVRDIKDMADPLAEYTNKYIVPHRHLETRSFDPTRIDFNPELITTNWITVDGRIWTTTDDIAGGITYIVKVNGRFPSVFFSIDSDSGRIVFSEPIDTSSEIEVRVLGVEEVQGILNSSKFDEIHARQVMFGALNKEQLPAINHEGRIREIAFPKRFLLERYSNNIFIVPQISTDTTKNFGDGTTFYTVIESNGLIEEIIDFDLQPDGTLVGFQRPSYSASTVLNLLQGVVESSPGVQDSANYARFHKNKFYVTNDSDSLYVYDPSDPLVFSTIGTTGTGDSLLWIDFDDLNNKLYAITNDPSNREIHIIDVLTGESLYSVSVVGSPSSNQLVGLAYNEDSNKLYTVISGSPPASQTLVTIDPSDGSLSVVGSFGTFFQVNDLIYVRGGYPNPSGIMYMSESITNKIYEVLWNTSSPLGSVLATTSNNSDRLTYRSSDNLIYVSEITLGANILFSLDRSSWAESDIVNPLAQQITGIAAPNEDFWLSSVDYIRMGDFTGAVSDVYIRIPVNIPDGARLSTATLNMVARRSNGNNIRLRVSILDPGQYSDLVDLSTSIFSSVEELSSISWNPTEWTPESNVSLDVLSLMTDFTNNPAFYSGRYAVLKITTLATTTMGHYREAYSSTTSSKMPVLSINYVLDTAEVNSDPGGFQSNKSYKLQFEFADKNPTRWVRITTENTTTKPNPVIDLTKRLRFRIMLEGASLYLCLGIREIDSISLPTGSDGGVSGGIEWVGVSDILVDDLGGIAPLGSILLEPSPEWQEIDIDLQAVKSASYDNGNGYVSKGLGVLEHIAFTVNPDDNRDASYTVYIDKIEQVDDLMVAGTSQGILLSQDFGSNWKNSRYTETPVHKFYSGTNNEFLWGISADEVLFSSDPAFWFSVGGTTGVQYIRDIIEDSVGNMYISTDRGVYFLDISLIRNFTNFSQTQSINAFSTDCYGMYADSRSSGLDDIWVSTELGIYKTSDSGSSWQDTGMNTGGLVTYQFINIGTKYDPNIIAINRKHVLRKMSSDADFSIIANLEEQHSIFDIWKMEYFAGRIYISTGNGVYMNSTDELFNSSIEDIPFIRVFDGADFSGKAGVAFGLDKIIVGENSYQLFIGQENRLMVSDEYNILTTKKYYKNKELPSFFVDNEESNIGYIYNAFNNVLCFREPVEVNKVVTSAYLPRKEFIAKNGGWAQTSPESEVFIYKNGIPQWIYFELNDTEIVAEAQLIGGKLNNIPELTTFNSQYPESQEYLDKTKESIQAIISGGDNSTPLVNNSTVTNFISNYERLLSMITTNIVSAADLNFPEIIVSGISRNNRKIGTRAAVLEDKEQFISDDATGIVIDTYGGSIDFLTAFSAATSVEDRYKLTFNKHDDIEITIFNANISGTGEFTHREVEDKMEDINTGLSSHLARASYTNLIKLGILAESQHNYMFDRYNVSNIQSRFCAAYTNEWYDILNSTVDYRDIIKVANISEPRFANKLHLFTDDPYLSGKFWVATDSDILQYGFDSDGNIYHDNFIRPGNGETPLFVWDMFVDSANTVYVVASDKVTNHGYIYKTSNFGTDWEELESINLPNEIYSIEIIQGTKIVGTEEGVFYNDNDFGTWYPSGITRSLSVGQDAETAFNGRIRNINNSTFLIAEIDRYLYTSNSGLEFYAVGRINENNSTVVNSIMRFNNLTWVGTDHGIYNDGNSILGSNVSFGPETSIEDSLIESVSVEINDITHGREAVYACGSNGKIYRFWDDPNSNEGQVWKKYLVPNFGPIQKVLVNEIGDTHYLVVVSYNKIRSIDITPGSGAFE